MRAREQRAAAEVALVPESTRATTRRRRRVLLLLGAVLLAVCAAFFFAELKLDSDTAVLRRSRQLLSLLVVGHAIACSTVLFQTVTNNRILTPSIMGFDAMFILIQTMLVFAIGSTRLRGIDPRLKFSVEVLLMVLFAVLLFRVLFTRRSRDLYALVLVGIIAGTLFSSLSQFVSRLIDPNEYMQLQDMLFASFNTVDRDLLPVATVVVVVVSGLAVRLSHRLDVVALGRETAINLGVNHRAVVNTSLTVVAVLVAVSTALVGPIAFLGLLVANLARQLLGTFEHRWAVPAASLVAGIALVGGQLILARVFGLDTALSVIINFVGGLYFIGLLVRENRL